LLEPSWTTTVYMNRLTLLTSLLDIYSKLDQLDIYSKLDHLDI
jgi:hypothetical protein